MNQILSHQHICVPVWTKDSRNERNLWAPDMLVHVQVTVIRMRYRSVFEDEQNMEFDHLHRRQRFAEPLESREAQMPAAKKTTSTSKKKQSRYVRKPMRQPVLDDPRVNDAKFREKYMWN